MNCPQCGNRNPSTAKHCLHCNMQFVEEREGLFESSGSDSGGNQMFWIVFAAFAAVIGGSMLLFGFDTYESKCLRSEASAARYEADPAWERDESKERSETSRAERRHREKTGMRRSAVHTGYLRCYRRKTGHVDGIRE